MSKIVRTANVLHVPPLFGVCEDVKDDIEIMKEFVEKEQEKENGNRLEQPE